jgi:putative ATP-dependent endonuclease of OLD family
MKEYGSLPVLHLRETRDPIGREEAEALLTLKVTRGGPERLQAVQSTVRSLLGG